MTGPSLEPDLKAAAAFLDALAPDGALTFQTFDDERRNRKHLSRVLHGPLTKNGGELARLNRQGAGVFVMVNRGNMKARNANSVQAVRALFVDLDGAPLEPVKKAPERPHLLTETSAGRFHAYWLVESLPKGQFKAYQKCLAERFGGDPKVCDLPRVMRLPGFYHCKREPFMVRVIEQVERPAYDAAILLDRLGAGVPQDAPRYEQGRGTPPNQRFVKLEHRHLEHENYRTLSDLACRLLTELVKQYNGHNNGDLCLAPGTLAPRGIRADPRTIRRARDELLMHGWVQCSRQRPRQCYLFALTFKPVDHCGGKHALKATTEPADTWKLPPDPGRRIECTRRVHTVHQRRRNSGQPKAA